VAAVAAAAVAVGRAVELAMEARSRAAGREDTGLDSSSGQAAERRRTEAGLRGRDRAAGHSRVISSRSKPLGDRFAVCFTDAVLCFDVFSGRIAVLRRCGLQKEYRGLSVCLSVTVVSPAKTAEPIEMPFGI